MGRTFYHNTPINQATLNFNFAHVYSSRREMDSRVLSDGVYVGRYVLIEYDKAFEPIARNDDGTFDFKSSFSYKLAYAMTYDSQGNPDRWTRVRYKNVDYNAASGKTFLTASIGNEAKVIILTETPVYDDDPNTDNPELDGTSVIGVQPGTIVSVKNNSSNKYEFYKVVSTSADWNKPAQFEKLDIWCENSIVHYGDNHTIDLNGSAEQQRSTIYAANYAYDNENYPGLGRGYDSTVWQKTLVNGVATYVQIAELNTVTPAFDIVVDPPSENSEAPYFDPVSSNVYYLLHDNPSWGFRIKGAQGNYIGKTIDSNGHETNKNVHYSTDNTHYASDVDIQWLRNYEGQKQYFNGDLGKWGSASSSKLPGAIYFNAKGFEPDTIHYSSEDLFESDSWNGENIITVTPTGQSGLEYGDARISKDGGQPAPDIQELSIMLPIVGDTVNKLWNLVYGDEIVNKAHYDFINGIDDPTLSTYDGKTRETDISWYDANISEQEKTKGLRLVDYNIGPDGTYTYSPTEIQTIAGCINSIHDLMGMIIYPLEEQIDNPEVVEQLSPDYIYYFNNKYWRRGAETYLNADFNPDELYKKINVIPFNENDKYFYKDLTNFKRLIGEPNDELTYYQFNTEANSMVLQTDQLTDPKNEPPYYYSINLPKPGTLVKVLEADNQRAYFSPELRQTDVAFYQSNVYYTKINPDGPATTGNLEKSMAETKDNNTTYYYQYTYTIYDSTINNTKEVTEYQGILGSELVQWQPGLNYYEYIGDGRYVPVTSPMFYTVDPLNLPKEGQGVNLKLSLYRCVNPQSLNSPLHCYFPNTYYYKSYFGEDVDSEDSGEPENKKYDYYLDSNPQKTEGRKYYSLERNPIQVDKFYKQNKFYYLNNHEEYVIDGNLTWTSGRQYYDQLELYVKEDLTGFYQIGSEWNQDLGTHNELLGTYNPTYESQNWVSFDKTIESDNIPPELLTGTKVGTKETKYKLYEMPEFARGLNTIHGMLLKLNALLNTDDVLTRNTETVQGCINKINDIIDLFGGLKPERFNIVNDKGKIVSADHAGDNWISVDIDGNARTVDITHKFTAVTDTTSVNNLNGNNVSYVSADTIQLYTPKVDTKGHVVGKNTETTVLPFGFKTIATNGTDQSNPIIADSTQDTLNINSGNSWIQTATDTTNDILTISHETHTVTPNNSGTNTLSSTDSVPSFTISQYGYDNAGHIISETNTTISGAAGYGIVKGNTGTSTADVSLDTLNIIGDSNAVNNNTDQVKLISTSAGADTLTITHETHTVTPNSNNTSTLSSTDSIPTFVINKYGYDNAGHIVSEINTTVSGVAGYGIIQGDNINQSTNEPITTTSTASLGKLIISGDNTWIKSRVTNQKVSLEHQGPETPSQHQATTSSPNFGDNLVLTNWYFDSKGHKNDNTNNTITFPSILFTENTQNINSNSAIVASLSLSNTDTTTEVTGKKINVLNKNVGSLTLTGYEDNLTIPQENRYITADSTIINAFRGTEQKLSDLKGSITGLNDDTISGTLANRIKAVETNTTDTTNSSTLISKVISLEQLTDNYGNIVSYDASAFDSAGTASTAASAVQGNTDSTVASVEASLINYLEINNAATTSFVLDDETDPNVPIEMTLQELYAYIKTLEDRIYDLEHPQSGDDPDPGNGGDDPTPQPSTPDVVIEFTEGTGSTTANFNDVLTNINNGNNDLTYSVIVDNTEINLNETTPVEVEEDNGVYTVIINLDDSIYEKITWINDGNNDTLTLIPIQNEP